MRKLLGESFHEKGRLKKRGWGVESGNERKPGVGGQVWALGVSR